MSDNGCTIGSCQGGVCSGSENSKNGVCGPANGGTFSSAPTTGLCADGSEPWVKGSGPWMWSCSGSCGGSSPSCSANKSGGTCTTLTYQPGYSGFSLSNTGPSGSSLTVTAGQSFYTYVDYGQAGIDSIQPPYSGSNTCNFDAFMSGSSGNSMARFVCTAPAASGSYAYVTGTQSGTSSNTCASAQNIGTVTVNPAIIINLPINPIDCNSNQTCGGGSSTPPTGGGVFGGGGTPSCGIVRLEWTDNSTNEDSFRLYKSTVNTFPGTPGLFVIVTSTTKAATAQTYGYDYNLGSDTTAYYYWITAYNNAGGESSPASLGSSVAAYSCVANIGDSDKDIVSVNYVPVIGSDSLPPHACNASTDPLPAGTFLNVGDNLGFKINLCNDYGLVPITGITVTDTMSNLQIPSAPGWNAKYNGNPLTYDGACAATPNPAVNHYCVSGTAPNQILTFNLTASSDNILAGNIANLTFTAQLKVPSGTTQNQSRFQNSFSINYNSGLNLTKSTPWLPFYTGKGNPSIIEVP
jgi:hypothetical protein